MHISHLKYYNHTIPFNLDDFEVLRGSTQFTIGEEYLLYGGEDDVFLKSLSQQIILIKNNSKIENFTTSEFCSFIVKSIDKETIIFDIVLFRQYISNNGNWNIKVSDNVIAKITDNENLSNYFNYNENGLLKKLSEEFLLSSFQESNDSNEELSRILIPIFTKEPTEGITGSFTIIGKKYRASIIEKSGIYELGKLTENRSDISSYSLVEGQISFVDEADKISETIRTSVERIKQDHKAYFNIWEKYRLMQEEHININKNKAGTLRYSETTTTTTGDNEYTYSFTIISYNDDIINFLEVVRKENAKVSIKENFNDEKLFETQIKLEFKQELQGSIEFTTTKEFKIPEYGCLVPIFVGEEVSNNRQKQAFENIKMQQNKMPHLFSLIHGERCLNTTSNHTPTEKEIKKAFGDKIPTSRQIDAVRKAIKTRGICLIQGPPGTGKTQVISAISKLLYEKSAKQDLRYRNLLTSFQHAAVDNMANRNSVLGLPAYRFNSRSDKDSPSKLWREKLSNDIQKSLDEENDNTKNHYQQLESCRNEISQLLFFKNITPYVLVCRLESLITNIKDIEQKYDILFDNKNIMKLSTVLMMQKKTSKQYKYGELYRLIKGIRYTKISFEDDGVDRLNDFLFSLKFESDIDSQISEKTKIFLVECTTLDINSLPFQMLQEERNKLLDIVAIDRRETMMLNLRNSIEKPLKLLSEEIGSMIIDSKEVLKYKTLEDFKNVLDISKKEVDKILEDYNTVVAATCQHAIREDMGDLLKENSDGFSFENVIIDEAARANPLDLLIPMSLAEKRIIMIGDHRQLPHILDDKIEKDLSNDNNYDKEYQEALKETLFAKLWSSADSENKVFLNEQFRMHPILGDFVSKSFYEINGDSSVNSGRDKAEFEHSLGDIDENLNNKVAVWINTPNSREQKSGHSRFSDAEANKIAEHINLILKHKGEDETIGIISFYKKQEDVIRKRLREKGIKESENKISIGTVDSFQGMEFTYVFLSVVRSNTICDNNETGYAIRKYGHLVLQNRLNVAMSRQQKVLFVVGNQEMFNTEIAKEHTLGLYNFHVLCGGDNGCIM